MNCIAGHTGLLGHLGHAIQHARTVLLDLFGIFGEGFCCDNYGYLGPYEFRQRQSMRYCTLCQLGPISWNENMSVHPSPPDCLDLSLPSPMAVQSMLCVHPRRMNATLTSTSPSVMHSSGLADNSRTR